MSRDGDTLRGDSTDGEGFVRSLNDAEVDCGSGARVLVLGAGGAARAIALALGRAGAEVSVAARRPDAAARAAALAGGRPVAWADRNVVLADADVLVNATPVGMRDGGAAADILPIDPGAIGSELVVAEIVVHPLDTALLHAARSGGARTVDGLGMLVHQAAIAFERWTGVAPPVGEMAEAARRSLSLSSGG